MARKASRLGTPTALFFAALDVVSALLVVLGVFAGLPARWWPVDAGAALLAAILSACAVGLALENSRARRLARVGLLVVLAVGLALVAAVALSASWLSGVYGPVGKGGALILVLVAALALPYLVGLPAAQLAWLGRSAPSDAKGGG
jgi:hypothetical protein